MDTRAKQENNQTSGQSQEKSYQQTVPSLSLPKGGGAIRGMGEKFAANPVTGTGSMSVPIATSPGRSGFGPQLSLSYDSGSSNGPFGFGWSLGIPSITRKTDKGLPKYQDATESDVFILSGAEDLVPILKNGKRKIQARAVGGVNYTVYPYRPRIEGLFARIERWVKDSDGDTHWRSITKDNILTLYGKDNESRIANAENPSHIFSWLICETRDDKGNAVLYQYKKENGAGVNLTFAHEQNRGKADDIRRTANRYLKRVLYGNRIPLLENGQRPVFLSGNQLNNTEWLFETVFDYGEHDLINPTSREEIDWEYRADTFSSYRSGFEVRTTRLCKRVLMFHHFETEAGVGKNCLVRSTDFSFSSSTDPIYTFLKSFTQTSYKRQGTGYIKKSLPPVEFEYSQPIVQDTVEVIDAASLKNLPIGIDGTLYQWVDLHGEGIPGILSEQGTAWFYKRNYSPIAKGKVELAPLERVSSKPNLSLATGAQFMDLAGDGQPDVVVMEGSVQGLYEHDLEEGWESFQPFTSRLNRETRDPNLKFVDLDGDGHADVLISEDNAFVWHPSLEEAGFGPALRVAQTLDEEKGPRLVFAEPLQTIFLADMSGDGLTDLVRIRNGEVCYWPNLGYGRFGAKVSMDHAPYFDQPDQFEPKRLRLADIDGSGTTDLIYLHRDGVRLYFNQSGNSWGQAQVLSIFPKIDDIVSIVPTDLLGNGTACLVWSSPLPGDARRVVRYVNLMGAQKPHLMINTKNNLGAETRVVYAPSTKFYLQDKRDGKPWVTKLPFPVHVIERTETYDHISKNRFVSRYKYHHGYFDGIEREFRGFGFVEQWDTEEIGKILEGENWDAASFVPPVHTKTWFHTGAYFDAKRLEQHYRDNEYFKGDPQAVFLDDTVLPNDLGAEESREACRALKGATLRQEVYADDGADKADIPYTVAEQNYTIKRLQEKSANQFAVFFTHAREVLTYHYERNPSDPRIQQAVTLEVDAFGNVLKSAAIGYGRRIKDNTLDSRDQDKQSKTLATLSENSYTNIIDEPDNYRTPLPCEALSFELTGPGISNTFLKFDDVEAAISTARAIAYHETPTSGQWQMRVVEHSRVLYRENDLSSALGKGKLESLAVPFETYTLAFTPKLLETFKRDGQNLLLPNAVTLMQEGGYVDLDSDGHYWIPSGRMFFHANVSASAAQELNEANTHFFLPRRYRDPFGYEATVTFDGYDLLMKETKDALGNVAKSENNYRVLQPFRMTDPNEVQIGVVFDVLGLVAGTALLGKPGQEPGDNLVGFEADVTQIQIKEFFDKPVGIGSPSATLLNNATTRIIYDVDRFQRLGEPPFAATLVRETHVNDAPTSKLQVGFSYSDGFGREIQKKIQAEKGPLVEGGPDVEPRWVGSGWTVFNNKGKPIRQYEPFFSQLPDRRHRFESDAKVGVSPVLFYDPVERVVATLHPNHAYEKVVFNPWEQTTYDVNDTVLQSNPANDPDVGDFFKRLPLGEYSPTWHEQRKSGGLGTHEQEAASKAAIHANTPTTAYLDSLGRTFLTIARNGTTPNDLIGTRVLLDIEGNQQEVHDARNLSVMTYDYSMLSQQIHQTSMDAGQRWMLSDVTGKPIRAWDSRGHTFRNTYDELRRPVRSFVIGADEANPNREILFERIMYGDGKDPALNLTPTQILAANLRGKPYKHFDSAGVVTSEQFDIKGNLLRSTRQLVRDYKTIPDWSQNPVLETEIFSSGSRYDALNRPIQLVAPHSNQANTKVNVLRPGYNDANLLERVDVWLEQIAEPTTLLNPQTANFMAVTDIDYDAKGQRMLIAYGNGTQTSYTYDPLTFRLTKSRTTNTNATRIFQDLSYIYDPVGNITHIQDEAQPTTYFNGRVVEPHNNYIYDAIYRLIEAIGREHLGQVNDQPTSPRKPPTAPDAFNHFHTNLNHPGNSVAMGSYKESYVYDKVGNILEMRHQSTDPVHPGWKRCYQYATDSNRLLSTTNPNSPHDPSALCPTQYATTQVYAEKYDYDTHGNMIKMPHLPVMRWDFKDQLQATAQQVFNSGTPETTYYVYDAGGQRVRKVTELQAPAGQTPKRKEERIYLGGFEVYRSYENSGDIKLERETLHVMDDKQRIALVEIKTKGVDDTARQLIRYQLGNHLGSASLELDDTAQVISYEEYTPYGSTSYQAVDKSIKAAAKRYRFTGKERDEENGFSYHGARYYALWLGRWVSCDPIGIADGLNIYSYSKNNTIMFTDPQGTDCKVSNPNALWAANALNGGGCTVESKMIDLTTKTPAGQELERRAKDPSDTLPGPTPKPTTETTPPVDRTSWGYNNTRAAFYEPPNKYTVFPTHPGIETGSPALDFVPNLALSFVNILNTLGNAALVVPQVPEMVARKAGVSEVDIQAFNDLSGAGMLKLPAALSELRVLSNLSRVTKIEQKIPVILDTNAQIDFKTASTLLKQGEYPVTTPTILLEHLRVAARKEQEVNKLALTLPIVADSGSPQLRLAIRDAVIEKNILTAIETNGRGLEATKNNPGIRGMWGDGIIGATAMTQGLSLITADKKFYDAMKAINPNFDIRFFTRKQ